MLAHGGVQVPVRIHQRQPPGWVKSLAEAVPSVAHRLLASRSVLI
jgi:hypothetical protein